jgi:hypothetical protein
VANWRGSTQGLILGCGTTGIVQGADCRPEDLVDGHDVANGTESKCCHNEQALKVTSRREQEGK